MKSLSDTVRCFTGTRRTSSETLRTIFFEVLEAVKPAAFIRKALSVRDNALSVGGRRYDMGTCAAVHVYGSGKASIEMARAVCGLTGPPAAGSIVISNYMDAVAEHVEVIASSHPVPTEKSVAAAELLMSRLALLSEKDFFIYLLSGGSSALVEKPVSPLTLDDVQQTTALLLRSGAAIAEVNIVRKHLSMVKGGRLGRLCRGRGIVLVISDVIGDDLEAIGSAPLYCDRSTYRDAMAIFDRSGLREQVPERVRSMIADGMAGGIPETPDSPPAHIDHFVIGSNAGMLAQAQQAAAARGLGARIMPGALCGEAREAARMIVSTGREIMKSRRPGAPPLCLLFGGETTVTVRGSGRGGRNQEMCLAALREIGEAEDMVFLSAGSDGIDGNSSAAGAVADGLLYSQARQMGLNIDAYLDNNDSTSFFEKVGGLINTGATGTNVMDIAILLVA